jgi:hypothetical protein
MKTAVNLTVAVVAGFLGGLLADYFKSRQERPPEEIDEQPFLLEDTSPIAARHALTLVEERPAFAIDEQQRPYALMYDIDDVPSERVGDKPSLLEEPQPDSPD